MDSQARGGEELLMVRKNKSSALSDGGLKRHIALPTFQSFAWIGLLIHSVMFGATFGDNRL